MKELLITKKTNIRSLLIAPLKIPKKGQKVYTIDEKEIKNILKRRGKLTELDPGMGGVSPKILDDLLETRRSELVSLDLALTAACNFKCTHCYKPKEEWNKSVLEFETISSTVNEAVNKLGTRFFVLTGGEPLMYNSKDKNGNQKDYFDVVDLIRNISIRAGIKPNVLTFSDVALINSKKAKQLAEKEVSLCLKRDTLDHKIQNKILNVPGGSQKMVKGYENLFAAGYGRNKKLSVSVNQVLRKGEFNTLKGSVDLHLWVKENGMEHSVVPIHLCGSAENDEQDLNPLEVKALYDINAAIDGMIFDDPWKVYSAFPKDKTCNRPGRGVHARVTGNITACSESPLIKDYIFGNINESNLLEIVRSEQYQIFKEEFKKREGKYICNPEVCDLNSNNICRGGCATRSAYSRINPKTGLIEKNDNELAYTRGREDPLCPGWAVLAQKQGVLKEGVYEGIVNQLLNESKKLKVGEKELIRDKVISDFLAIRNTMD